MIISDQLHASASLFPGRGPRRPLNKALFGTKGRSESFERKNSYLSQIKIKSHYLAASSSLNTTVYQLSYFEIILEFFKLFVACIFSTYGMKTN